jgi:hypothetical protein
MDGCWACAMEQEIRQASKDIRQQLQAMNPNTDPNYQALYMSLVENDGSLRILLRRDRADR